MKEHFNFFGPVTFLYAVFYAFCMFHNGSGITFPFFLAGTLLYFVFSLSKLEITLKKGSAFYMISILLLGVSTFCTDGWAIIGLNKLAVFLWEICGKHLSIGGYELRGTGEAFFRWQSLFS